MTNGQVNIKVKSIFAAAEAADGFRVLVDDHLPPELPQAAARFDLWLGQIAPSPRLQKWYRDDRAKWDRFLESYFAELDDRGEDALLQLFNRTTDDRITLLFVAKDARCNTAVALKMYLEGQGDFG